MVKNVGRMNYRKFYELMTGEQIPHGFQVHHLDHDKENNDIFNLVAIHLKVHIKYHKKYNEFKNLILNLKKPPFPNGQVGFYSDITEEYFKCCEEIQYHILKRNRLIQSNNE